jgi:hypothetical protein
MGGHVFFQHYRSSDPLHDFSAKVKIKHGTGLPSKVNKLLKNILFHRVKGKLTSSFYTLTRIILTRYLRDGVMRDAFGAFTNRNWPIRQFV